MILMNTNVLLQKFSQGLNWNAFFYAIYKFLSTALSLILFKFLTTQDFSTWANINSIIFLALLWLDFGMRKSLPRYCPEFAKDKTAQKRFIMYVLIFQGCMVVATLPLFMYGLCRMSTLLDLHQSASLLTVSCMIFCMEALVSLLRLIYHAHFWIKQFNVVNTAALMLEMIANICIIMTSESSTTIVTGILVTKAISGLMINAIGLGMLRLLYKDTNYPGGGHINFSETMHAFVKHSGIMWVNNNLKSLTERNFLMPLFTYTAGHTFANLFKIANDGALLFYRIVLKTIGTTDTSLLAHAATSAEKNKLMPFAFQKLTSKIAALCIPLLGVLVLIFLKGETLFTNPFVFQAFFIMAIGYLIELIISPYERLLEINRRYVYLTFAYVPYIVMIVWLFNSNIISSIGLLKTLVCIHSVRLVSYLIMVCFVRISYPVHYPLRFTLLLIFVCISVGLGLSLLLHLIPLTLPLTQLLSRLLPI